MQKDDYDITTRRIDWSKIHHNIASANEIGILRNLEGDCNSDQLLAADADIQGVFFDPTVS